MRPISRQEKMHALSISQAQHAKVKNELKATFENCIFFASEELCPSLERKNVLQVDGLLKKLLPFRTKVLSDHVYLQLNFFPRFSVFYILAYMFQKANLLICEGIFVLAFVVYSGIDKTL